MTFLRNIMGQRNQDYVSDIAAVQATERRFPSGSMRQPSSRDLAPHRPERAQWCCMRPEDRKHYIQRILNNRLWKASLILFTFFLLFGAQIRVFLPKQVDTAFDVIFMLGFVFFSVDILLRMDAERNYFHLYLCGCVSYSSGPKTAEPSDITTLPVGCCGRKRQPFHVGSFLFFCDVVSTFVFLREISFLFPQNFEEEQVYIGLGKYGLPQSVSASVSCMTEL